MARGRVIDREIYSHETLMGMDVMTRYFYQGLIIWADDEGRIKGAPHYLKAKIFPCDNISVTDILKMVNQLTTSGLLYVYGVDNKPYIQHPKWSQWQTIRKDRFHPSDCPLPTEGERLAMLGIPRVDQMPPEPNLTKPNLTKEKTLSPGGDQLASGDLGKHKNDGPTPQQLVSLWNSQAHPNLPRVVIVTKKRESHIRARLVEHPAKKFWDDLVEKVNSSPHLRGENDRNWKCSFDWILNINNMAKILEGNYDPNKRTH